MLKVRRYLMYFGYIGTRFRGIEKELSKYTTQDTSISKHILVALNTNVKRLKPHRDFIEDLQNVTIKERKTQKSIYYPFNFYVSSRTDAGVHAIRNSAHLDLELMDSYQVAAKKECLTLNHEEFIKNRLNTFFDKEDLELRIHRVIHVPDSFHARFDAMERTYLYRLAVLGSDLHVGYSTTPNLEGLVPEAERDRVHIIPGPFDADKVREACRLLEGERDFRNFVKAKVFKNPATNTVRTLSEVKIVPGSPSMNVDYDPLYKHLQYWDICFKGRAFLYNQVRRMVGAMVGIGTGSLSIEELKKLVSDPLYPWPGSKISKVPACGLYLVNVRYPDSALAFSPAEDKEGNYQLNGDAA